MILIVKCRPCPDHHASQIDESGSYRAPTLLKRPPHGKADRGSGLLKGLYSSMWSHNIYVGVLSTVDDSFSRHLNRREMWQQRPTNARD